MFTAPGMAREDLMQDGAVGLLQAASNFSEHKGAKFATYASIRANGNMQDAVRKYNTNNSRFMNASDSNIIEGATADDLDLADHLESQELQKVLIQAFFALSDQHRKVLIMYYQKGCKQQEIATQLKLTEARVSQLLRGATNKLHSAIE